MVKLLKPDLALDVNIRLSVLRRPCVVRLNIFLALVHLTQILNGLISQVMCEIRESMRLCNTRATCSNRSVVYFKVDWDMYMGFCLM